MGYALGAAQTVAPVSLRTDCRLWTREFAFVGYPGHPAFTPAGAIATPMAPPRSIALCKKPDTRTSSINALTAASAVGVSFGTMIFCGTLNKSSGNNLVPGVVVESVVRRWRFAPCVRAWSEPDTPGWRERRE
jgi:hypothetical protein